MSTSLGTIGRGQDRGLRETSHRIKTTTPKLQLIASRNNNTQIRDHMLRY